MPMFNQYMRGVLAKAAHEAKFVLGRVPLPEVGDREVWLNGRNVYDTYAGLYSDADMKEFRRLARVAPREGALLPRCERIFKKYLYPALYGYRPAFGGEPPALKRDRVEAAASSVGNAFLGEEGRFATVRGWLGDEASRRLFDLEVLQKGLAAAGWYPPLAELAVCTGLTQGEFKKLRKKAREAGLLDGFVKRGGAMGLILNPGNVDTEMASVFLLGQYEYGEACVLREGDTFLDCGACLGDTLVWAIAKVGPTGTVVSFEPLPGQAAIARENARRRLARQACHVTVECLALGDQGGEASFRDIGAGSFRCDYGAIRARVARLDDYCREKALRPDFIKMDIEGSELAALKGAEATIREVRPRLAICVYHKPAEDLWEIPRFIKDCVPSYRMYLKKNHPWYDTVLFAVDGGE